MPLTAVNRPLRAAIVAAAALAPGTAAHAQYQFDRWSVEDGLPQASVNDILQRLPSSGGGLNSKFNNSGNLGNPPDGGGVGAGAAEIDLRYLGSRRVLVLVDGLRFVNGASASGVPGSTDLNAIPESSIERIEVLQDGASAIYGSDAIAGVVNIITKRSQDGFRASAQLGGYLDEGDGFTQDYLLALRVRLHRVEILGCRITVSNQIITKTPGSPVGRRRINESLAERNIDAFTLGICQ